MREAFEVVCEDIMRPERKLFYQDGSQYTYRYLRSTANGTPPRLTYA
jgi:hypothetical protein